MNKLKHIFVILMIVFFSGILMHAQSQDALRCVYLSPPPGAKYVQAENNIIIRFSDSIDWQSINSIFLSIEGSIRQEYKAGIQLLKDQRTLIIRPDNKFKAGETIHVRLKPGNINTLDFEEIDFQFDISKEKLHPVNYSFEEDLAKVPANEIAALRKGSHDVKDYIEKFDLPLDFPPLLIGQKSDPDPGYFFMSCIGPAKYNIIVDNNITPIYYQKYNERIMGLDVQQANGYLTFSRGISNTFIELDSTYEQRRTYTAGNGYFTDFHELLITEDSTYWLMIYDPQLVDMSQVIEGGNPDAIVIGLVIQELNHNDEVIFQWRSWDHFEILECDTNQVNLYGIQVDYVHGNALDLAHDGNILISSRHLNEITKIDTETGEVIWRMGGNENQFTLSGDNLWFTDQHGIREIKTDTISLFDNGNYHNPAFSRGVEYAVDEETMKLTFLREYRHDPDIIVSTMGMMQRDSAMNAVIGWSRPSTEEVISEYHPDGSIAIEILCPNFSLPTYRVFKREWETSLFDFDRDSLDFGSSISAGDSLDKTFLLKNTGTEELWIHKCFSSSPVFEFQTELPLNIPAGQQKEMKVRFKPVFNTDYTAKLTLSTDTDTSRIAKQIYVHGSTLNTAIHDPIIRQMLRIFPNPAKGENIILSSEKPMESIQLFDARGLLLRNTPAQNPEYHELSLNNPGNGIFFLRIIFRNGTVMTEKIIH